MTGSPVLARQQNRTHSTNYCRYSKTISTARTGKGRYKVETIFSTNTSYRTTQNKPFTTKVIIHYYPLDFKETVVLAQNEKYSLFFPLSRVFTSEDESVVVVTGQDQSF